MTLSFWGWEVSVQGTGKIPDFAAEHRGGEKL